MVTRLLTVQRGAAADAGSETGAPGQCEVAFPSLSAIGPGPEALPGSEPGWRLRGRPAGRPGQSNLALPALVLNCQWVARPIGWVERDDFDATAFDVGGRDLRSGF
jgi:hypothetical protein